MTISDRFLLSVDAGIRTGLALYNSSGELKWYRSHNLGSIASLRKVAYSMLKSIDGLEYIVVEGGGSITNVWINAAQKLKITTIKTDAGEWRKELLYLKEHPNSQKAKESAIKLSRQIIDSSEAPAYNTPTHDAAEAILIGKWGCKKVKWIQSISLHH
ncbi:MAG: hypothetical protein FD170_1679 [Bacteroidetes bacterium]|nr:MAG: hypothetical protein FD170_1679 [Bacteroidota bacterium]